MRLHTHAHLAPRQRGVYLQHMLQPVLGLHSMTLLENACACSLTYKKCVGSISDTCCSRSWACTALPCLGTLEHVA